MKPLYIEQDFQSATSRQRLPCECIHCGARFTKPKNDILDFLNGRQKQRAIAYCSRACANAGKDTHKEVLCKQCSKPTSKSTINLKRSKSGNLFCSQSCAAKWNNSHKTKGTRVSKLERWLADRLPELYPDLEFHFNRKDAIESELDIFIPSLRLAFELNGIFHYEPIFGPEKLASTRFNDDRKFQACIERGIELCILDVSSMEYFKPIRAQRFLDIVTNIVNIQLSKTKNWSG